MRSTHLGFVLAVALTLVPSTSFAAGDESPATIGLGFRSTSAPIGGRWWVSPIVGIDVGFDYSSESSEEFDLDATLVEITFTSWVVEVGVPVALRQWQRVHFIARPGFFYNEFDDNFQLGELEKRTIWIASLDLEVEVFLVSNFSVSASQGVAYTSDKLEFDDNANTRFTTRGGNLTTVGFHVYLW